MSILKTRMTAIRAARARLHKAKPKKASPKPAPPTPYQPTHVEPRKTLGSRVAYRVRTRNGTLVLCDRHLDALRSHEAAKCTGDTFAVKLCDHCHPERT